MRFAVELKLQAENNEPVKIPVNYRQHISALLKEALQSTKEGKRLFNRYYAMQSSLEKVKPFTFSCYLPVKVAEVENNHRGEKCFQLGKNFIKLFVSTSDYEFLFLLYNGLHSWKEKRSRFKLANYPVEVSNFFLISKRIFINQRAVFKTLTPILVRSLSDSQKYLLPEDCLKNIKKASEIKYCQRVDWDTYKGALEASMRFLLKRYLKQDNCFLEIKIDQNRAKEVAVLHGSNRGDFLITFCGLDCILEVECPPEAQELFYDIGIGARRSEGFGMLEVLG